MNGPLSSTENPRLITLGTAELRSGPSTDASTIFGAGKPFALLAYLALCTDRSASREHILDLLWADAEPEAGRHALSQTIWFIHRRVGRKIIGGADVLTLCVEISSDRDDFLNAIDRRDYAEAIRVYDGEFMPQIALSGGLEFEHWADVERHRLRMAFIKCAEELVRLSLKSSRYREAASLARRVRDIDPVAESGWRLVLHALLESGDDVGAAIELRALEALLGESGQDPEASTRALMRVARHSKEVRESASHSEPFSTELVGREADFARLVEGWALATHGEPKQVLICGPAGIGKSRLIAGLEARIVARRGRTIVVRAKSGEQNIEHALLAEIARKLAGLPGAAGVSAAVASSLVSLSPALSDTYSVSPDHAAGGEALRRHVIAVHELLAAVADEAPIGLLIDDLHWADDASLRAISGICSRLERECVQVTMTTRPSPKVEAAMAGGARIDLTPLDKSHVSELLANVGALPAEDWADRLADRLHFATHGLPLLIVETLQLLGEGGLLVLRDDKWACENPSLLQEALQAGSAIRARLGRLGAGETDALAALAVAGMPLDSSTIAEVCGQSADGATRLLRELERRGFIVDVRGMWQPAHDELAATALIFSPQDRQEHFHRHLAEHHLARSSEPMSLIRAARHAKAAGDDARMLRAFNSWVSLARARGDRRSARTLGREFLGSDTQESILRSMLASLSWRQRYPTVTAGRVGIAAAGVAFASVVAWGLAASTPPPPEAVLILGGANAARGAAEYELGLRPEIAGVNDVIDLGIAGKHVRRIVPLDAMGLTRSPDDKTWALTRIYPDSGGYDIALMSDDGNEQRLTLGRSDDTDPVWSPDASQLAFITTRFDSLSHHRLAVLDLHSGKVRRLSRGSGHDLPARWSPSGAMIAFGRHFGDDRADELCTVTFDGNWERCHADARYAAPRVRGWYDDRQVVLEARTDEMAELLLVDVFTNDVRQLAPSRRATYSLSPDARWVTCLCRSTETSRLRLDISPIGDMSGAREIRMNRIVDHDLVFAWAGGATRRRYLASLRIIVPADGIPLGGSYMARALGRDEKGEPLDVPLTEWTSLDTTIASVDSMGILVSRRTGSVKIVASAGGWRVDTALVHVISPTTTTVLDVDWRRGLDSRFVAFGEPLPMIVEVDGSQWMFHGGDKSFMSGMYSKSTFSAKHGLGAEAVVRTPIGAIQWQSLEISLTAEEDDGALARWDRRTGYFPKSPSKRGRACTVSVPAREGASSTHLGTVSAAGTEIPFELSAGFVSGAPYTIRIQILPDGRCAASVNGAAVAMVARPLAVDLGYRLVVSGQSVGTRMLVGPLRVWQGMASAQRPLAFSPMMQATPD